MIINQSLFGSKINKETTLGTDGHFLSPFGPQYIYLTLDDEIRLKKYRRYTKLDPNNTDFFGYEHLIHPENFELK